MKFDRWKSIDRYTHVFRLFSKYHEYMNSMFWASVPTIGYASGAIRKEIKLNQQLTTHEILHIGKAIKNANRVATDPNDYLEHLKEFENWNRLNTLVSACAYFETYLSSVVSLAIESDLGLLYSIPQKIDGISVLKHNNGNEYSFFDKSELITKGEWPQRISNFKKLFGVVPQELIDNTNSLEKMRVIRNNVAHAFGRDIKQSRDRNNLTINPIERLSLERLQKYMGTLRSVAKAIDNQLLEKHIGEYELIYFYHIELKKNKLSGNPKELKKVFNGLGFQNRGLSFYKDLIEYYDNVN
ncbi:hypothetical protein [Aliarcobacter lanthieri]|uniref:hypothetical protein n=1 Tax=Aliarcobacter lanthieri TaxID=1355374 RepID=UPI003AAA90A9